jgi:hypothetical protein
LLSDVGISFSRSRNSSETTSDPKLNFEATSSIVFFDDLFAPGSIFC